MRKGDSNPTSSPTSTSLPLDNVALFSRRSNVGPHGSNRAARANINRPRTALTMIRQPHGQWANPTVATAPIERSVASTGNPVNDNAIQLYSIAMRT